LFDDAEEALLAVAKMGIKQAVLSAMEQENLVKSVKHVNINHFFSHIAGIKNHYAHSKVERGFELLHKLKVEPQNALLIGDTLHDKEVADKLRVKCILIARGHQHPNRLKTTDNLIVESLMQAIRLIPSVLGE
jgi:phosphoglycolate phosphatase